MEKRMSEENKDEVKSLLPIPLEFEIGDICWIYGSASQDITELKKVSGKIIEKVDLSKNGLPQPFYIILVETTFCEPDIEIRDGRMMSRTLEEPTLWETVPPSVAVLGR